MRHYDDPVEVRTAEKGEPAAPVEPEEFFWQGRLWQVRKTVAHWVESGPWWTAPGVRAVLGSDDESSETALGRAASVPSGGGLALREPDLLTGPVTVADVVGERRVWRVEAACPREQARPVEPGDGPGEGVFDLVFSWATGSWRLTACLD